jgi:hypothetical protein
MDNVRPESRQRQQPAESLTVVAERLRVVAVQAALLAARQHANNAAAIIADLLAAYPTDADARAVARRWLRGWEGAR